MKLKTTLLCAVVALMTTGNAFAQISKSNPSIEFAPRFFVQFQDGIAYTFGEGPFTKLISPVFYLGGGYEFNPLLAARLNLGYGQSRSFIKGIDKAYASNLFQAQGDVMLNLTNLLLGYNHKRALNLYPFVGGGVNMGVENYCQHYLPNAWEPVAFFPGFRTGLHVDLSITNHVSATLEGNYNWISDKYNSKIDNKLDQQLNVLAGLKFKMGQGFRTSAAYLAAQAAAAEAALAAERAAAERAAAEKAAADKAEQERLAAERAAAEKAAAEKAAADDAAAKAAALRAQMCLENSCDIFFPIDKHYITKAESAKVKALAEFLLAHPDFSVALCGYADVNTGTHKHNMPLSERRVKSVSKALQELGVPADRIATDFKGDTVQPYSTPETNRVVICKVR